MTWTKIILIILVIYFVIAAIVYLCTRDVTKSLFWIFYIICELGFDDFDNFFD